MTQEAQAEQATETPSDTLIPKSEEEAATEAEASDEGASEDEYKYAGKFTSVEELEKGYKEATGKLREKNPAAPEEYEFKLDELESLADYKTQLEGFDIKEDPMLAAALPAFKKHNLSQEAVNDIVADVLKVNLEDSIDSEAELQKLGDDAPALLANISRFNAKFPAEQQHFLENIGTTAEGVKFISKMMDMMGEKSIPTEADQGPAADPQELIDEANKIKRETTNFETNTQAQARYEKLMDDASRAQLKQK